MVVTCYLSLLLIFLFWFCGELVGVHGKGIEMWRWLVFELMNPVHFGFFLYK